MPRIHLFEIEDQEWLPDSIRNGMTDYMRFLEELFNLYGIVASKLLRVFRRSQSQSVIDLCSGAGGAWEGILRRLGYRRTRGLTIHLTDRFPNLDGAIGIDEGFRANLQTHPVPVNALAPPDDLEGCFTIFSALHHFRPAQAQQILANAIQRRVGIGVFEMSQRHLLYFLYMLTAPVQVMLLTPFVRPFRLSRLFWTYVIPAIPLFIFMDGFVSGLRTYSIKELRQLLDQIPAERYCWEMGVSKFGFLPVGVTWLIGYPAPDRKAEESSRGTEEASAMVTASADSKPVLVP